MKTKVEITELTHDDLVNLISTACYGSSFLGVCYDSTEYEQLEDKNENDCIEDKCARLLLHGKSIELYDMYAEDEGDYYGELPHYYDETGFMFYTVKLTDIMRGLEKAATDCVWSAECFNSFVQEESMNMDLPRAETLCQYIIFGEQVYG